MQGPTVAAVYVVVCVGFTVGLFVAYSLWALASESAAGKGRPRARRAEQLQAGKRREDRRSADVQARLQRAFHARRRLRVRVQGLMLTTALAVLVWGLIPAGLVAADLWPESLHSWVTAFCAFPVASVFTLMSLRPTDTVCIRVVSGCWLVIALLLTGCFVALALGHPEDDPAETEWYFGAQALICSGRVLLEVHATVSSPPPRRRLLRLTGVVRGSMALGGLASLLYFPLRALYLEPAFASSKDFVPSLAIGMVEIVCAVLLHPRLRGVALAALSRIGSTPEEREAAVVASLCSLGRLTRSELLPLAEASFRAVRFDKLRESDLSPRGLAPGPAAGAAPLGEPCELGECDAFVSHAWSDPAGAKWAALRAWAERFEAEEGRWPKVWVDRVCIDQANIEASLPCLPIFLAGCHTLVILAGPSWSSRLWCVIELFTFLRMKGAEDRICVVPLLPGDTAQEQRAALEGVVASFASFDARQALCSRSEDREALLAVIETSFGSLASFSEWAKSLFSERATIVSRHFDARETVGAWGGVETSRGWQGLSRLFRARSGAAGSRSGRRSRRHSSAAGSACSGASSGPVAASPRVSDATRGTSAEECEVV